MDGKGLRTLEEGYWKVSFCYA